MKSGPPQFDFELRRQAGGRYGTVAMVIAGCIVALSLAAVAWAYWGLQAAKTEAARADRPAMSQVKQPVQPPSYAQDAQEAARLLSNGWQEPLSRVEHCHHDGLQLAGVVLDEAAGRREVVVRASSADMLFEYSACLNAPESVRPWRLQSVKTMALDPNDAGRVDGRSGAAYEGRLSWQQAR